MVGSPLTLIDAVLSDMATEKALERAGIDFGDLDLIEQPGQMFLFRSRVTPSRT